MRRLFALTLFLPLVSLATTGGDLTSALRDNSFDRDQCYRVRDLIVSVEDIRIFLTDGHLIFSKPVAGWPVAAVFTADTDGGDAEIIVMPPNRAERQSLARYIESPNLNEHVQTVLLFFSGDVYEKLKEQIDQSPSTRKTPELGPLMDEQWTPVLRNISTSLQTRLALDLLGGKPRQPGLFTALLTSAKLGNFDVLFDPLLPEQILVGQVANRNGRTYFDTWTAFEARSFRNKRALAQDITVSDYRIEATIAPDLDMSVVTRLKLTAASDGMAAVPFEIAPQMRISQATVNGRPAEVLQRDGLRANIMRDGNELFLAIPEEPLRAGQVYEFEFQHSGRIITAGEDRVYFVTSRAEWYPTQNYQFSHFDLLFRYPRDLNLVTAGDVVEDRTEGEQRITRRRTSAPIRLAGFNLGDYAHERVTRAGYSVDVYANRSLEAALRPAPQIVVNPPMLTTRRPTPSPGAMTVIQMAPSPTEKLRELALEVASALEFMASKFGPPALPTLTVAPIPGNFGQGFPGLIYLSTLSYLKTVPGSSENAERQIFFQDVLQAHETAHQWWGNRVTPRAYRDNWLMEALANYSALLYVEKRRGARVRDLLLESYRAQLLEQSENGQVVDAAGPIVLGGRLESSIEPRAYRAITYGKGTWILHMLRARMGDARFYSLLAELAKRYDRKEVTTGDFHALAAKFLPPKSDDPALDYFFEQWVYGTGVPGFKLDYSVKGKPGAFRLTGTIAQSDVGEGFTALVPVEIQIARGKTITQWVRTGSEPATFSVAVSQRPLKVTLDPDRSVLRR